MASVAIFSFSLKEIGLTASCSNFGAYLQGSVKGGSGVDVLRLLKIKSQVEERQTIYFN